MGIMNVICFQCGAKEYDVTPELSKAFASVHSHGKASAGVHMHWIPESKKSKINLKKLLQVIKGK